MEKKFLVFGVQGARAFATEFKVVDGTPISKKETIRQRLELYTGYAIREVNFVENGDGVGVIICSGLSEQRNEKGRVVRGQPIALVTKEELREQLTFGGLACFNCAHLVDRIGLVEPAEARPERMIDMSLGDASSAALQQTNK